MDEHDVEHGPPADGTLRGTVVAFDEPGGYGTVEADASEDADGPGARWFFHCTAIADGSRTIEPGTAVQFEVTAGRMGRYEATAIHPE